MGKLLKVLGIILIILGILGSIFISSELNSGYIFIACALSSLVFGATISGLGELIILTEENKQYTYELLNYIKYNSEKSDNKKTASTTHYEPNVANQKNTQKTIPTSYTQFKVCPNCGEENPSNKLYCMHCGAPLK